MDTIRWGKYICRLALTTTTTVVVVVVVVVVVGSCTPYSSRQSFPLSPARFLAHLESVGPKMDGAPTGGDKCVKCECLRSLMGLEPQGSLPEQLDCVVHRMFS